MKSRLTAPLAATLMLLGSAPLMAGDLPFNAPSTHRAQETAQLLQRAAHAIYDSAPGTAAISDLWLFPTSDPNTVFAEYELRTSQQIAAPTEHLVVLTLQGNRVLSRRELTDTVVASTDNRPASLDWTAMIGTGGTTKPATASTGESSSPSGGRLSGTAPHWTAKIGTGSAADANSGTKAANPGSKATAIVARAYSPNTGRTAR